jgi:hypothetical protein
LMDSRLLLIAAPGECDRWAAPEEDEIVD